jgi:EAL domain-containing protein (putative c-di-GMP-specific phosphodiesterase class I)
MRVVVEGVETEAQLEAVRKAGCDEVQGFLLGRPAPVGRMDLELLKEHTGLSVAPETDPALKQSE